MGGNVEVDGFSAQRMDLTKISRSDITASIDKTLQAINNSFNKQYGVPLWSPELIANREFLSGSAFHFFSNKITDDEFRLVKTSVGDIDTMVDVDLATQLGEFLTKSKGKQFGKAKLIGFKPNPGNDTFISLWQLTSPKVRVQIDMELVSYENGSPSAWSKFSHSSSIEDLSEGVKGVFHKYLLRAITHKDAKERYLKLKTKLKKVVAADLAFAVSGGIREKFEPVIDPVTGQHAVHDGLPVYKEIPPSASEYVKDIPTMFKMLFRRGGRKDELKKLGSFVGCLELIKKYFTPDEQEKIYQAFVELLFGKNAQQLYKGDPETDRREKEIALIKISSTLGLGGGDIEKIKNDYYSKYKVESINEAAEVPNYKRQSIKHLYAPGSTVQMSDKEFLAVIGSIADNDGKLDDIPITLKVDGAGIRFGRDEDGKAFLMTSKVTEPLYADNVGVFEKYSINNNAQPEIVERAKHYDKALELIVNSDFIKALPKDSIVNAEMLYNDMAVKTDAGLKFVNISYDPKKLGKSMTLVPLTIRRYSTGEELQSSYLDKLIAKSNKDIKIVGANLEHTGIDVKKIVEPVAFMDGALRQALSSRQKDNKLKDKAKAILNTVRRDLSNAIITSPKLKGLNELGENMEGIVIAFPNGILAKVTTDEMKSAVAAKKTTKSNRHKIAVVTVGSFVGHIGHQKVVDAVISTANKLGGDPYIYISSKVGPEDPIPPEVKLATWHKLYPKYADSFQLIKSPDGTTPSPIKKIEKELVLPSDSPYKKIILMVGSDRYAGFKKWMDTLEKRMKDPKALAKFGGTQNEVDFDTVEIPRGSALGGIDASFTDLRNVLKDPNLSLKQKLSVWEKGFGNKLDSDWIKKLIMIALKGMNMRIEDDLDEEIIEEFDLSDEDITDVQNLHEPQDDLNVHFHEELNPALFRHGKMLPEVREKLIDIADDFKESIGVPLPTLKDVTVSGSNAAYSYTPSSDIDLHLIVDMSAFNDDKVMKELFDAKKFQYNEQHDYKIRKYDVEVYVQDSNEEHVSQGVYSVLHDTWINEPKKITAQYDETSTREKYDQLKYLIEKAIQAQDYLLGSKLRQTIKKYRQVGLHSTGEFGPENLAFKALRTNGYIKKLYDMLNNLKDQHLSLESIGTTLTEVDMSPGTLQKFSSTDAAKKTVVGFEFEMIYPDALMDQKEEGPDYDYDERVRSRTLEELQDDVLTFFLETEGSDRITELFDQRINDDLTDYIEEEFQKEISGGAAMRYLKRTSSMNMAEIRLAAENDTPEYRDAIDELRDEFYGGWDDLQGYLENRHLKFMSDWHRKFDLGWPFYHDGGLDEEEISKETIDEIGIRIKDIVGMPLRSSTRYHSVKERELNTWYLETDSSIEPDNPTDAGLELVSPPMPLHKALEKFDIVVEWMKKTNVTTNASTGFHMGVSIPKMKNLDYMKLIMFLGDEYLLKQYGRLTNPYCQSIFKLMKSAERLGFYKKSAVADGLSLLKRGMLDRAAKTVGDNIIPKGERYVSININEKYVEFRIAGGDYLNKLETIKHTLLRYVRVMNLAADPNEAKSEYAKKLYKFVSGVVGSEDHDSVKLFTMLAMGEIDTDEVVYRLLQKKRHREEKKDHGPEAMWTIADEEGNPITSVETRNGPVQFNPFKANTLGAAKNIVARWMAATGVILDYKLVRVNESKPASLAGYIAEADKPFEWKKEEPEESKKKFTDWHWAHIMGGHLYEGEK